jgi:hypothetical protein
MLGAEIQSSGSVGSLGGSTSDPKLAIGFALPTLAQEQKTVDPEVRQQIEAIFMKYQEAHNKHDAAAAAALFTPDAVEVWQGYPGGSAASGQQAIEKRILQVERDGYCANVPQMV